VIVANLEVAAMALLSSFQRRLKAQAEQADHI
jgi:hypothetical protein